VLGSKRALVVFTVGLALWGCARVSSKDIVASVGGRVLTRQMMAERAGVPFDSLSPGAKHEIARGWAEETLLLLEAERRGISKDPAIENKLIELRSELLRARLLHDLQPAEAIRDSAIAQYYEMHQTEFVRAQEEYEIELYWAPDLVTAELFRRAAQKDIEQAEMTYRNVTMEGIWRALARDLAPDEASQLAVLDSGKLTEPRVAEDGYRLMRLRSRRSAGEPMLLEDVRHEIRERLMMEASRIAMETLLAELRRKYSLTIRLGDSL